MDREVHATASLEASATFCHPAQAFYETAGAVKVYVFAFVFSLVALLFLLLLLPFLVSCIHLGLLSALFVNPFLDSVHIGVR